MVNAIVWRVGSDGGARLLGGAAREEGVAVSATAARSRFADPEGLQHELVVAHVADEPLIADHPEIPRELALQGFEGARAYARTVDVATAPFLERARVRA